MLKNNLKKLQKIARDHDVEKELERIIREVTQGQPIDATEIIERKLERLITERLDEASRLRKLDAPYISRKPLVPSGAWGLEKEVKK